MPGFELTEKLIGVIQKLTQVNEKSRDFIDLNTQGNLDELVESIGQVDKSWEEAKVGLVELIQLLSGTDAIMEQTEQQDN